MKELKVFGGMPFNANHRQERCVIAAYSQKQVAEIIGTSLSDIRGWWCVTGNKEEIEKALAKPLTPIWMGRY